MKEIIFFQDLSHNTSAKMASVACFLQGNSPFDEELVFFFSKMAADSGINLSCFLVVEVMLEVQNGVCMDDN